MFIIQVEHRLFKEDKVLLAQEFAASQIKVRQLEAQLRELKEGEFKCS